MKKLIIFTILLISLGATAQINPVMNLQWNHWYSTPYNLFELSWSPPLHSANDTLKGYRVYRNNLLYRFQTDTVLHHSTWYDNNTQEDFIILSFHSFYIHVTAVYNSNFIESIYTDSAYVSGVYMGIEKPLEHEILTFPNPAKEIINLKMGIYKDFHLTIFNQLGQIVLEKKLSQGDNSINIQNLSQGIYFYNLIYNREIVINNKFMKE